MASRRGPIWQRGCFHVTCRTPRRAGNTPEKAQPIIDAQIARASAAVAKLRARGVPVVFVRAPSSEPLYPAEERGLPRALTWDVLLQRSGAPGIHFMDYESPHGFKPPDWSHLAATDADQYTEALVPLAEQAFAQQARL